MGDLKVNIGDAAKATPAGAEPQAQRPLIHEVDPKPPVKQEHAPKAETDRPVQAEKPVTKEGSDLPPRAGDDKVGQAKDDSYGHLLAARAKYDEIKKYMNPADYPNPAAKITVNGKETTVNDYVKELKRSVRSELSSATDSADKIPQGILKESINANALERVPIAAKYGINLLTGVGNSREDIDRSIEVQLGLHKNNPSAAAELEQLKALQKQANDYQKTAEMPSATRMIAAQYMAIGATSDKYGAERGENGKPKVDITDIQTAAHLVNQAGANREFRENSAYQKALQLLASNMTEGTAGERIQKLTATANGTTDIKAKEDAFKKAMDETDKMGLKTLAGLVHNETFMAQQPQEVKDRMNASVNAANDARLAYARYLTDTGRVDQAEVLMAKIKTDDPSAVYKPGPDGKIGYQSDEIRDLDRRMAQGSSANPDDMLKLVNMLDNKMKGQQLTSTDAGKALSYKQILEGAKPSDVGADQILRAMDELNTKKRHERQASLTTLNTEKTATEAEIKRVTGDKSIDDLARQTKQAELQDKLKSLETTLKQVQEGADKQNNREDAVRCLFQMNLDLAQNNKSSARASLDRLKQVDPEFYRDQIKEKDKLEDACTEVPWYKDWRTYAIGAAFVVGAVVGFGVGGMATGTAMASILCVGGGMLAGGAAGGLAYYGVHKGAELTGWARKDDPANFWQDFKSGFRVGSTAAGITATIPAFAAAATLRGTAAVATMATEQAALKGTQVALTDAALTTGTDAALTTANTTLATGEVLNTTVQAANTTSRIAGALRATASLPGNALRAAPGFYASYAPVGFTAATVNEGVARWNDPTRTWSESGQSLLQDGFLYSTGGGLAAKLPSYKLLQGTKLMPFVPVARNSELALDLLGLGGTEAATSFVERTTAQIKGSDYVDPVTGRVPEKRSITGPSDSYANDLNDPRGKRRTVLRLAGQFSVDPTSGAYIPIIDVRKNYDPLKTWQPTDDQTP